jgi:hypothetical protein
VATPLLSPTSVVIPDGGSADIALSWTLDPGTADEQGSLRLEMAGTVLFDGPITKQGRPAETAPVVVTSDPQPGQVLVTCDVATVTLPNQQTIRLS